MFTYDEQGYLEPGSVYLQLKSAEVLHSVADDYVFDVDIRDYNLWMIEEMPVILILFDASRRRAFWLCVQSYFSDDMAREPKKGAKTVRVRVPSGMPVNRAAVAAWRALKRNLRH